MKDSIEDETGAATDGTGPAASVYGLVDSDRAAAMLGTSRVRVRSWLKRKLDGGTGLPQMFPDPLPVKMNRGTVWAAEDLAAFKKYLAKTPEERRATPPEELPTAKPAAVDPDPAAPLYGLMDSDRVAILLGSTRERIRSWLKRKRDGSGGLPSIFPEPLPEQLNGGWIWRAEDLTDFAAYLDEVEGKNQGKTYAP